MKDFTTTPARPETDEHEEDTTLTNFDTGLGDIIDGLGDFGDAFDVIDEDEEQARADAQPQYTRPKVYKSKTAGRALYDNADKLARALTLSKGERADCFISGNFIFGDFIEAYIVSHNAHCPEMVVTTLSLSQNNVDSLYNLLAGGFVDDLTLIVSSYFFFNERRVLIPYIYERLDQEQARAKFRLAVADIHTKTAQFRTDGGRRIIIHGSANLRSSGNIEQFTIEENAELYDFYLRYLTRIADKYQTTRAPIRGTQLWDTMTTQRF